MRKMSDFRGYVDTQKPVGDLYYGLKDRLYGIVNSAYRDGLPYFLIEILLSDLLHQVRQGAYAEESEFRQKQLENFDK